MANILTNSQHYTDIANAIRNKNGENTQYYPSEMADAIYAIEGVYQQIIVNIDTGSTVTATKDGVIKTANERNGIWGFNGLESGDWTITATLNDKSTSTTVTIVEGELCQIIELAYYLYASDFDWASYGTLGVDYLIVDGYATELPQSQWGTYKNWHAHLLTSGTLKPLKNGVIDVFCVGGGSAPSGKNVYVGETGGRGGGGGGYTSTTKDAIVSRNVGIAVVIGAGGDDSSESCSTARNGGKTSFGSFCAAYGGTITTGTDNGGTGGNGGCGGGGNDGNGGSDGSNGNDGSSKGGTGQGTTTRPFGESYYKPLAGGGAGNGGSGGEYGGGNTGQAGIPNTGGGGGSGGGRDGCSTGSAHGGSGIVIIRPAKEAE